MSVTARIATRIVAISLVLWLMLTTIALSRLSTPIKILIYSVEIWLALWLSILVGRMVVWLNYRRHANRPDDMQGFEYSGAAVPLPHGPRPRNSSIKLDEPDND